MRYLGDFSAGSVVKFAFNTRDSSAALVAMTGSPAVSVYKHGSTTESTSGVTLTQSFDSRTGLHTVAIDTSADGTFYATANEFYVVLTTGTVDGVSQVGTVLAQFSIGNRGSGGGLDAAGVRSAIGLASANLDTQLSGINTNVDDAETAVLAKLPSALVGGKMDSNVSAWRGTTPGNLDSNSYLPANLAAINGSTARALTFATDLDNNTLGAVKLKTDNLPSDPADASDITASFSSIASTLATIAAYIDTEVAAIKAKTDNLPASPASEATVSAIDTKLGTPAGASVSADIAAAKADTAAILLDTGTDGVVVASDSKTGYALSATGLDALSIAGPSGPATTFRQMVVQLWKRFFGKVEYDKENGTIKTYEDATVITTQTATTEEGTGNQSQGAAS